VSLAWALVRNVGTCRPDTAAADEAVGGLAVARGRTPSSRNCQGQSTDAGHRGGPSRSSGEAW